jgi:hypothetical protein
MLKIKKWHTLQKDKVDNTNEWSAWQWENVKTKE